MNYPSEHLINSIEEIAYRLGYISREALANLASEMMGNEYGQYLMNLIAEDENTSSGVAKGS